MGQFKDGGVPKCSGKICKQHVSVKEPAVTFIDDSAKMPYIRGDVGDVFYILVDSIDKVMRTYKRIAIDGVKLKANTTYKLTDLL